MRKRVVTFALAACLALGFAFPANAAAPASSSNINAQNYTNWDASPVDSYLFANQDGGLTRVEHVGSVAVVEEYDTSYRLRNRRDIRLELPVWGGFFAGAKYNFFVFGQSNPVESDSVEVIRVVKYSRNWERLGSASIRGANTTVPFYCGSLRMAEAGNILYIRTSHKMYRSSGGGAQSNMTIAVDERDMSVTDSAHLVADVGCGYVSDSFNQFILADSSRHIAALDQGDDFPERRAVISVFAESAGGGRVTSGSVNSLGLLSYPLPAGGDYRVTGCSIGGFGDTRDKYIVAYSYDGAAVSTGPADRSVYLAAVDKQSGEVTASRLSGPGVSTPQLVINGGSGGYILWNEVDGAGRITDTLRYASFDSLGKPGDVKSATAPLSDCVPVYVNGKAVWYVTDGGAPVFYELSDRGVQKMAAVSGYTDVPENDVMNTAVMWSAGRGYIPPVSDSEFGRNIPCSRSVVVLAIWRAVGSPEPKAGTPPFTDVAPGDEYYKAVLWAYQNGVAKGDTSTTFSPDAPVKRCDAVTFLFRAAGAQTPMYTKGPFADVPAGAYYAGPVLWAVSKGITNGVTPASFCPERTVTKSELAAFLYRWSLV